MARPVLAGYRRVFPRPFEALSVLRGTRGVHPQGVLCRGTLLVDRASPLAGGAELLQPGAEREVLARFSRLAGLPQHLGDVFGLAVRVFDAYGPGAHQDLLCNSSLDLPLVHRVFLPACRWYSQACSSCLHYDGGAGSMVVGWLPPGEPGPGPSVDALRATLAGGGVRMGIGLAPPLGRFERIGALALDAPVDAAEGDVDFDPSATPAGACAPWAR